MNETQRSMSETLALFHEQRLSATEQREVEELLQTSPEWQTCNHELQKVNECLESWGAYWRSRASVIKAVCFEEPKKASTPVVLPSSQAQWMPSLAVAASFLVVIAAAAIWFTMPSLDVQILESRGQVSLSAEAWSDDSQWKTGKVTTGDDGLLEVQMGDKSSSAMFGQNTVASISGPRSIAMESGVLYTEVAKQDGKQYTVTTPHGVVQVLGTKFEVQVTEHETIVKLKQGSVKVHSVLDQSKSKELKPGEQVSITKDTVSNSKPVPVTAIAAWAMEIGPRAISDTVHRNQ